jgi:hypothetical protein
MTFHINLLILIWLHNGQSPTRIQIRRLLCFLPLVIKHNKLSSINFWSKELHQVLVLKILVSRHSNLSGIRDIHKIKITLNF